MAKKKKILSRKKRKGTGKKSRLFLKRSRAAKKGWKTRRKRALFPRLLEKVTPTAIVEAYQLLTKKGRELVRREIVSELPREEVVDEIIELASLPQVISPVEEKREIILGIPPKKPKRETADQLTERLRKLLEERDKPEAPKVPGKIPELKVEFIEEVKEIDIEGKGEAADVNNMTRWLKEKLSLFARDLNVDAVVNRTVLPDGTGVVQIRFDNVGDMDKLLLELDIVAQDTKGIFKSTFAFKIDPTKIVRPTEIVDEGTMKVTTDKGDRVYNTYKGMIDIPMNISKNMTYQIADARGSIVPALEKAMGVEPDSVTVTFLYGESVMGRERISREYAKKVGPVD